MDLATAIARVKETLKDMPDEDVEKLISRAESYFYEKTRHTVIPDRAAWLIVDLSIGFYRQDIGSGGGEAAVSSIKRGDTTIQYNPAIDLPRYSFASLDKRLKSFNVVRAV
jgi:hypothetical protein